MLRQHRSAKTSPSVLVPQEVKDASHQLNNAVQSADYHVRAAEKNMHPITALIRAMRKERHEDDSRLDSA